MKRNSWHVCLGGLDSTTQYQERSTLHIEHAIYGIMSADKGTILSELNNHGFLAICIGGFQWLPCSYVMKIGGPLQESNCSI